MMIKISNADGTEHYTTYFEDPDRIKVNLLGLT